MNREILLFLIVLMSLWLGGHSSKQLMDFEEEIRLITNEQKNYRKALMKRLSGVRLVYVREIIKDGTVQESTETRLNFQSETVWRLDLIHSDGIEDVYLRQGRLFAAARRESKSVDFRERIIGFGEPVQHEVEKAAKYYLEFLFGGHRILEVDIDEFLRYKDLKILSITDSHGPDVGTAKTISWERFVEETKILTTGEVVLLPMDGHLVKSFNFRARKSVVQVQNDFTEIFGVLIPKVYRESQGQTDYVSRVIETATAESDPNFYSPKSLGISPPFDPRWRMITYFAFGVLFLTLALLVYRSRIIGKKRSS